MGLAIRLGNVHQVEEETPMGGVVDMTTVRPIIRTKAI